MQTTIRTLRQLDKLKVLEDARVKAKAAADVANSKGGSVVAVDEVSVGGGASSILLDDDNKPIQKKRTMKFPSKFAAVTVVTSGSATTMSNTSPGQGPSLTQAAGTINMGYIL